MKHLSQNAVIAAVSFLGELFHYVIPLPIPGSIYGLVLMFLALLLGIVKVHQVKTVSDWLISLMPIMFVTPLVSLIGSFEESKKFILPIILTTLISTPIVMVVTGRVSQALIRLSDRKEEKNDVE